MKKIYPIITSIAFIISIISIIPQTSFASYHFSNFQGRPPIHIYKASATVPGGLSPADVKSIYNLPKTGGHGTIAIIEAYDDANLEKDLGVFDAQFNLPACTIANSCLEKHATDTNIAQNANWSMETSLDVEWAHAIAPTAKIVVIEVKTPSGANLLKGIDYAASRKDAVAISMSWGGAEFSDETTLDPHFKSVSNAIFFASSGDNGAGVSWPAVSPNVVSVGGTSLALTKNGSLSSETAWSGSGGGVSAYETEPNFQKTFSIAKANNMRAVPDVSYNADPKNGFPIYRSSGTKGSWYVVGGTSAGAPQWAAIQSLGLSVTSAKLYGDKSSSGSSSYFRDITSGSNGSCTYYCDARKHYDYVTGLGSPLTVHF